jgi:hypothetical protein
MGKFIENPTEFLRKPPSGFLVPGGHAKYVFGN